MPDWAIIAFILAGLLSFAGGLFDWEWFMTNYRAAIIVRLLGRARARVFYALLGLLVLALGFAGAFHLL